MTEVDWLQCTEPERILQFLGIIGRKRPGLFAWWRRPQQEHHSDRKLRLFACACCRRFMGVNREEVCQKVLDTCERFADGSVTMEDLLAGRGNVPGFLRIIRGTEEAVQNSIRIVTHYLGSPNRRDIFLATAHAAIIMGGKTAKELHSSMRAQGIEEAAQEDLENCSRRLLGIGLGQELTLQCDLLRCIFANPFRPISISPSILAWRDSTIPKFAQSAYDNRQLPGGHLDPTLLAGLADALEEAGCQDAELLSHLRSPGPHVRGCWPIDLVLGLK